MNNLINKKITILILLMWSYIPSGFSCDIHKYHHNRWESYARTKVHVNKGFEEIHDFFKNKCLRFIRYNYNSNFKFQMIYQVDDVTELVFDFSETGKLTRLPTAVKARLWKIDPKTGTARSLTERNGNGKADEDGKGKKASNGLSGKSSSE